MTDKPLLFIVDDEIINLEIMQETLVDEYNLILAENGSECLQKLKDTKPDVILLDVNMPGMTGIEVCEHIKSDQETRKIPVLFVSALGLPEERVRGYMAGGDDYITKPFDIDELLTKVELTIAVAEEKKTLKQSSDEAMNMAMTAMTQASEIGIVMQFIRDSHQCTDLNSLAERLISACNEYELEVAIRLTENKKDHYFSSSESVSEREINAMKHIRDKGRFVHFGKRTMVNFDHISLLVKNMPVLDEGKYGRINDNIGLLVEGADSRIIAIEIAGSLITLIDSSQQILKEIEQSHKENGIKNAKIMDELEDKIEWGFINMGLSDLQEDYFRELLHNAKESSSKLYNEDMQLEAKLQQLIDSLSAKP